MKAAAVVSLWCWTAGHFWLFSWTGILSLFMDIGQDFEVFSRGLVVFHERKEWGGEQGRAESQVMGLAVHCSAPLEAIDFWIAPEPAYLKSNEFLDFAPREESNWTAENGKALQGCGSGVVRSTDNLWDRKYLWGLAASALEDFVWLNSLTFGSISVWWLFRPTANANSGFLSTLSSPSSELKIRK